MKLCAVANVFIDVFLLLGAAALLITGRLNRLVSNRFAALNRAPYYFFTED